VVVDVLVVDERGAVPVAADVLGGDVALLLGDVEDRLATVGVPGDEDPLVVDRLHRVVDPARPGRERRRLEVQPVEVGPSPGEGEQLVGLDGPLVAVLLDVEPDAAVVRRLDPLLAGVGQHLDVELLAVVREQGVPEGDVGLVERPGVVLDDRQVHPPGLAEVGDEFHPGVAEPHDDARVVERRRVEHVRAGRDVDVPDAGQSGQVHRRAGGDDDVVGRERPVADGEPRGTVAAVVEEAGGVAVERDVLPRREVVDRGPAVGGERRGVLVLPLDDGLKVDRRRRPGEAVVVARREPVFGGREDLLGRHTAAEDTEATARVTVVDERQLDVRRAGEPFGGRDAGTAVCTDDSDVSRHA